MKLACTYQQSDSRRSVYPKDMPSTSLQDIPKIWEIYESLGYRPSSGYNSSSTRPAKQIQELTRSWRNEYCTNHGVLGKDLTNWDRDQSDLRTMATQFLRTNRVGITQWPRVNHSAPEAPKYEGNEQGLVDLLSQLFWRQNKSNAYNQARKPSTGNQTARQTNDRNQAQRPVAGGGSPSAQGRSVAPRTEGINMPFDDSDDGSLSPTASEGVENGLQFLKDEFPSTSQNERLGIRGTSVSRPSAGVLFRPGVTPAVMERVSPAKRKRTPSAEPPRAPHVPGSVRRIGSPETQERAFLPAPQPSRAGSRSCQEREVPRGGPGLASTGQKPTEPVVGPVPNIRYRILVKSRPRPRSISWANATLRDRTMDDLFDEVGDLAEVEDIQRIKFTLHGLEQDYTAKKMDRHDGVAFADMLDSWGESMHEEMHAPVNANFVFDIVLELELPEMHTNQGGPEVKDSGTPRSARKQYSKLIF